MTKFCQTCGKPFDGPAFLEDVCVDCASGAINRVLVAIRPTFDRLAAALTQFTQAVASSANAPPGRGAHARGEFELAGISTEPPLGYRVFDYDPVMPNLLASISADYRWHSGMNEAACMPKLWLQGPDVVETIASGVHDMADCTCGFYAYHSPDDASYSARGRIAGIIEGYGTVLLGTKGFRAQRAQIVALCVPEDAEVGGASVRRHLAAFYPHAILYGTIEEMVDHHRLGGSDG